MIELGSAQFWKRLDENPAALAREVCFVDVVNLDETLQQHAALRAWINAAYESARIIVERAKWDETKARALGMLRAKSAVDPDTGKFKTVQILEAEVDADERVERTVQLVHTAQDRAGALRAMSKALEDRKDMLVQIAAKQRQELKDYT